MRGVDKKPEDYRYKVGDVLICRAACYYPEIEVDEDGDAVGISWVWHDFNGEHRTVIVLACVDDMCCILHPLYGTNWVLEQDLGTCE